MDEAVVFKYLTEPVLGFNLPTAKLKLLLNACEDHQILTCKPEKEPELNKVFGGITKKISEPLTRHVGILLLKTFLPQCYDEIFAQNGIEWMKNCITCLEDGNESIEAVADSYELLISLFELSGRFKQLNGPMSVDVVPGFFNAVTKGRVKSKSLHKSIFVLRCLKPLMKHYGAACQCYGHNYVWTFLWEVVYCDNSALAAIAGECMCYFTKDPGAKNQHEPAFSGKVGKALQVVFSRLCATASELLFQLFQNVSELKLPGSVSSLPRGYKLKEDERKMKVFEEAEKVVVPVGEEMRTEMRKLGNKEIKRVQEDLARTYGMCANRFVNVLSLLEGMLRNDTQFPKRVNIPQVLSVAFRALRVNGLNIRNSMGTVEHIALLSVLPAVHAAAFNFLRCFVTCYDGLHGYGVLFCQLVLESLQWTVAPCVSGNARRYGCVREAAYLFLEAWAIRASAGSCVELFAEELVVLLLEDVAQKKETVTLQMKSQTGNVQQYLTKETLLNPQANAETCAAALRAIRAIIEASGSLLKTHQHLMLQETVVSLLLEVRRNNLEYMPYPYSSPECRLQLYRVLLALTVHPNGSWPAPLQFALTLFPYGQRDPSLEVSSFCLLASATTRQMVHPSRSNAQFPISLEDMRVSAGLKENPLNFSLQGQILSGVRVNGGSELNAVEGRNSTPINGISPQVTKRKLQTPTSVTSLNGRKENTSVSSSDKKAMKNCSPASKKKKLAPVVNAAVNGLENDFDSNVVEKKKSKLSLEMSGTVSVSPSSSERPLKKKRSLSESTVGSFDLSGSKNSLRLSSDSWTVVDLPQQESSKKKKKKEKKKRQVDERSVDVEPPSKKGGREPSSETTSVKTPLSSDISWNVSETQSHKIFSKKSFTKIPLAETESPAQQERTRSLGEGKTSVKVVPVPCEVRSAKQPLSDITQEKSIVKGKGGASSIGNENAELRKERAEEEMVKKTEKEKQVTDLAIEEKEKEVPTDQRPSEDSSTSPSSTLEDPPLAEHSSSSVNKSPTPVKDSNTISECDIRTSNEKPRKDETLTAVKDSETTTEYVVDMPRDKETRSHCGEKPQEDKPSTPVKESKVVSEDTVKISDTVTIEEIPSEEVCYADGKPKITSAARDAPIVDLADSDNSCSVISLDSDGKEEQSKEVSWEVKESAVNMSFEDCQDPDAATGMDAVVESPRISLEGTEGETTEHAAGGTSEKPSVAREDGKKDSDTDEEDILTTFVDIVSTNSG